MCDSTCFRKTCQNVQTLVFKPIPPPYKPSDGQSGLATAKSGSYRRGSDNTSCYQNCQHVRYAHLNKATRLYRNKSGCQVRFL